MIQRLKTKKSRSNVLGNASNGVPNQPNGMGVQQSEIETLQAALSEAMLRERQLIQEQVQREDEMKQQKDAQKQHISVIMKEKMDLEARVKELESAPTKSGDDDADFNDINPKSNLSSQSPPSQPPPSAPDITPTLEQLRIEARQNKE